MKDVVSSHSWMAFNKMLFCKSLIELFHKSLVTLSLYFMHNSSCLMSWFIMYRLILSQYTVHSKIQTIFLRYIKSHWLLISSHRYHMSPISLNDKVCARLTCYLSLTCQWIMVMHQPVILSNSHGMKYRNSLNTSTWVTHTYKNSKW